MGGNDSRRKTIVWSLAALFAAMLADLAQAVVDPVNSSEGARFVAGATDHHGRMVAAAILVLVSALCIAPGVVGLARLLERRGRYLGRAAMVLAYMGALGHAVLAGLYLVWAAMPAATGAQTELIAAIDRANESPSVAVLAPFIFAFPVSLVVFLVAMARGGLAPRWVLVPALAAPVVAAVGPGDEPVPTVVALVLLLVASCGLAARLLAGTRLESSDPVSATVAA